MKKWLDSARNYKDKARSAPCMPKSERTKNVSKSVCSSTVSKAKERQGQEIRNDRPRDKKVRYQLHIERSSLQIESRAKLLSYQTSTALLH